MQDILVYYIFALQLKSQQNRNKTQKILIFKANFRIWQTFVMQTLTSVYSWGNIKTVPAFHHKDKTKLPLFSFTCKHLPGENFCLDYLLSLHYSFPKQYLSQILNCCHLEKRGVSKIFLLHSVNCNGKIIRKKKIVH